MTTSPADDPYVVLIESIPVINGRYHNPTRIGPIREGYFSLLFKARDATTGKEVALKFFDPRMMREQYRRDGFTREARLLGQFVGQPSILQLLEGEQELAVDLRTADGITIPVPFYYFVTELAPGSLKHFIYSAANNPHDALVLFREACKGIQRLHAHSVCHRDFKPDNGLVFPGLILKVCDLGTARRLDEATLLSRYDIPVGDRRYSALELFCGVGNDPRWFFPADLFSLGAILFELFTRQILTQFIYDFRVLDDLSDFFAQRVPESQRREKFQALLPHIQAKSPLPDLRSVDNIAPSCIVDRLNHLYRCLSDFDYRKRARITFPWIFRQVEICLIILENEAKYRQWLELRRRRRCGNV